MIAHTTLAVSDYRKAKAFYTKVLATLGYSQNMEYGKSAGFNDGKNTDFWISAEKSVVPTHLAFQAKNRQQVEAFHKAAIASGTEDNGPPGYPDYSPGYFAAFVLDADGNNIEAVWYDPAREAQTSRPAGPKRGSDLGTSRPKQA
jgi:catechol 2,3-dioxygenase-like lactoylglutathione lyase family enzyme